jgi:CRP/FNR family transcriptional regulator
VSSSLFDPLYAHVRKFVPLSESEEKVMADHISFKKLKRKEFLLKEGQVCQANYFIIKGVLRMFIHTKDGLEHIVQFGIDNWWITDFTSFDGQKPSQFNIQSVEDSEIGVVEKEKLEELLKQVPALERYFRLVLQRAFAASVMRLHYIFDQSGEERYRHFNNAFPDFVQRVPQYMLASYLGFTPEFLSKIRGKKDV